MVIETCMYRPRRAAGALVAIVLAATVCLLAASPATAQPKQGKGAKAEAGANDTKREAAKTLFKVAVEAFKAERYEEALDKLTEVYKLDPHPIILYNIGRSWEELGNLAEAADFFQRAVSDDRLPDVLKAEVGKRLPKVLPALKARQARTMLAQMVAVGVNQADDASRKAALQAARDENRPVTPREPTLIEKPMFWAGVGAEAVGLGLLIGGALIDGGLSDPIDELMNPETRRNAARTEALQNEIERDQLLATSFYVGGGLLVAAGGVALYFALLGEEEAAPPAEGPPGEGARGGEAASFYFTPILTDEAAGLSVGGAF